MANPIEFQPDREAFSGDTGERNTVRSIESVHIFHTARVADQNLHIVASGLVTAGADGEKRELDVIGDSHSCEFIFVERYRIRLIR